MASTNQNSTTNTETTGHVRFADKVNNQPPVGILKKKKTKKKTTRANSKFDSINGYLKDQKSAAVTQHSELQKEIAANATAMYGYVQEILRRHTSNAKFGNIDEQLKKLENDDEDFNPFIPNPFSGGKQPLTSSKRVMKDERCTQSADVIKSIMEKSEKFHAHVQKWNAVHAGLIGREEEKALIAILQDEFIKFVKNTAIGLVQSEVTMEGYEHTVSIEHLAYNAINTLLVNTAKDEDNIFYHLPFINDASKADEINKFIGTFMSTCGINYESDIKPILDERHASWGNKDKHPDTHIVDSILNDLGDIVTNATVNYWIYMDKKCREKKLGAQLKEKKEKEKIDQANKDLENAMDVDNPMETLDSHIDEAARRAAASQSAKKKSALRKNSSGGTKTQVPKSTENGRGGRSNSRRRRSSSSKRSAAESDDDSTSRRPDRRRSNTNLSRGRSHRRSNSPATRGTSRWRGQVRRFYSNNQGTPRPRRPERSPSPYSRGYKDQGYYEERDHRGYDRNYNPNYYYHRDSRRRNDYRDESPRDWRGGSSRNYRGRR